MSKIYTEPLVTLALGDPSLIPQVFTDLLDAITNLEPGLKASGRHRAIAAIVDNLTTNHMEVVKTIAALATIQQAAANRQTFTEWLTTSDARRILDPSAIALCSTLMDGDPNWPRDAHTYVEYRDHIARVHPDASAIFDRAWDNYRAWALAPYGDVGTISIDTQYATRIAWNSGDEIHPKTVNGTSRFEAERHAQIYNALRMLRGDCALRGDTERDETEPEESASASVVWRTVIYGPWYAV